VNRENITRYQTNLSLMLDEAINQWTVLNESIPENTIIDNGNVTQNAAEITKNTSRDIIGR
jgi:hypothetical protein